MIKSVSGYLCLLLFLSIHSNAATLEFKTTQLPPFMFQKDGLAAGPGKDIVEEACKQEGFDCDFEILPWRRAQHEVKRGTASGLFMVGKNEAREEWLHFSPPILKTGYGFYSQTHNPAHYTDLPSLAGLCVIVNSPSNMYNHLISIQQEMTSRQIKPIRIITTTNFTTAIKMLNGGRCDLLFGNIDVVNMLIKRLGLLSVRPAGFHEQVIYYIGLSKAAVPYEVVTAFNQRIIQLHQQGKIKAILAAYDMTPAELPSLNAVNP